MAPIEAGRNARIAVISDTHANILALDAALRDIHTAGVDSIIHLGDAIGFGPRPAECLDRLLTTRSLIQLMGNHDSWCIKGDAGPGKPAGIMDHLGWTWAQVNPAHRDSMENWPYCLDMDAHGFHAVFQHYALDTSGKDFQEIKRPPSRDLYDSMFGRPEARAVFFGHDHIPSDTAGPPCRYLDPGSLGTGPDPVVRLLLVTFNGGAMTVEPRAVPCDREPLWQDFEDLKVPGRTEIRTRFFT